MQAMPIRIVLILTLLTLFDPSLLQAAEEQRTALVIGNSAYKAGPLMNPANDATDMATTLQQLGFKVILKKDVDLETMESVIEDFGNLLKRGGVGLFYYAGHGVQVNGINYLIPVNARISKESDVRYKAVDVGRILDEMANANNGLNIVILDACRDNPFARNFRSASRGLAITNSAPVGTFISYSTSPGSVARDGEGRNSPYTIALIQHMQEPGTPITDVFMKVRQKLRKETGQTPWELSSLEGKFYFNPGKTYNKEESLIGSTSRIEDRGTSSVASRRDKDESHEANKSQLAMGKFSSTTQDVVELDTIGKLKIISYVPSQKSENFKKNLRNDLKIDTWMWDKIPYYMNTSSTKVILRFSKRIKLAGDSKGTEPWEIDNFLLLEIMDKSGTILKRSVIGDHDDVSFDGRVIDKIGPQRMTFNAGSIEITHLFPINQEITLKASAMDYGGLGKVSNIFLIIADE